ncbi:hypothetical protein Bca52824_015995 [Brassica carinata]|uniref:14-3-3 domain-containing protein n=1 Tax=Brassica carinata TaxID=52824 RepID=A0A8X8B661_BRACI|nr:hypothetical protein Bca52824_015995 [Brassica carinata]
MENDRGTLTYMATLAYLAKRYDDMTKSMRKVCEHDVELSDVERELLAIGYRNLMSTKRDSLRTLSSIEKQEDSKGNKQNVKLINKKLDMVKDEFFNVCNDILSLIDSHLIPSTTNVESTVYYYTMKANYFRYMAEFGSDAEREGAADNSLEAHKIAMEMAEDGLSPTNLVRLGLALNFSIFNYGILKSTESACKLAKRLTTKQSLNLTVLTNNRTKMPCLSYRYFETIFPRGQAVVTYLAIIEFLMA